MSNAGMIYLIHFRTPLAHARHYVGWSTNLVGRLRRHKAGAGSRLMEVVTNLGIEWEVSRLWYGDRARERQIKKRGGMSRLCPLCGVVPAPQYRELQKQIPRISERAGLRGSVTL